MSTKRTSSLLAAVVLAVAMLAGPAGAQEPEAEYKLSDRSPRGAPKSEAARQERMRRINEKFNQNHGGAERTARNHRIAIEERANRTRSFRKDAPASAARSTRAAGPSQNAPARSILKTTNRRVAGAWPAVDKPAAQGKSVAGRAQIGAPAAQAKAAPVKSMTGRAPAASTPAGTATASRHFTAPRPSAAGAPSVAGRMPPVNPAAAATSPGRAAIARSVAKQTLKGGAIGVAMYGLGEIFFQELADPGKTMRDLESGNVQIDAVELGAVAAASAAGGFIPGLVVYGVIKIADQETKDPGKTARDIKSATGIDLEQTGRDIEQARLATRALLLRTHSDLGQASRDADRFVERTAADVGNAVKDVGELVGGLFDGK